MKFINSGWTVIIVTISLCLALVVYFLTHEYKPNNDLTAYANDLASKEQTESNKMPQAKKKVQTSIELVDQAAVAWNQYVVTRTVPTSVAAGGIDISVDPYRLVTDTVAYRNSLQTAVNAQVQKGGVKLVDPVPTIAGLTDFDTTGGVLSTFYNYPAFKYPVIILNLGTIRVQGTYDQIMANLRAYKTMPHYLAVTDGLRLDGTSPNLIGSYQLSILGFVRGNKIWGPVPWEAAGGGAAKFGGFGGKLGRR
jgi:hypothetical protein